MTKENKIVKSVSFDIVLILNFPTKKLGRIHFVFDEMLTVNQTHDYLEQLFDLSKISNIVFEYENDVDHINEDSYCDEIYKINTFDDVYSKITQLKLKNKEIDGSIINIYQRIDRAIEFGQSINIGVLRMQNGFNNDIEKIEEQLKDISDKLQQIQFKKKIK